MERSVCFFRRVEAREKPAKSQRKVVLKRSVASLREILIRENLFHVNQEHWEQNTPSNIPRAPGDKPKIGKEWVHREELTKSMSRKVCPQSSVGFGQQIFTSSSIRTKLRAVFLLKQKKCRHLLQKDQGRDNS